MLPRQARSCKGRLRLRSSCDYQYLRILWSLGCWAPRLSCEIAGTLRSSFLSASSSCFASSFVNWPGSRRSSATLPIFVPWSFSLLDTLASACFGCWSPLLLFASPCCGCFSSLLPSLFWSLDSLGFCCLSPPFESF